MAGAPAKAHPTKQTTPHLDKPSAYPRSPRRRFTMWRLSDCPGAITPRAVRCITQGPPSADAAWDFGHSLPLALLLLQIPAAVIIHTRALIPYFQKPSWYPTFWGVCMLRTSRLL